MAIQEPVDFKMLRDQTGRSKERASLVVRITRRSHQS
jgi:hypothetical protein